MFHGLNPNNIVVLLVSGAVLLAAIYHSILFIHRGSRLLALYSIYLWSTFTYCLFRDIYSGNDPLVYKYFNPDEIFQMISFIMYIRFATHAMDLDKEKEKYAILFSRLTPYVIISYLVLNTIFNDIDDGGPVYLILKICARAYLLLLGLVLLVSVLRRRKNGFYKYLGAGAISMIIFGLISSVINLTKPETYKFGAISWLMFGFFTDVVFFSAAIGYRIRQEHDEKERSLQAVMQKDAELKEKELEKIRAIYETREQERSRIAQDLHDDIGATLSSIHVYSSVAARSLQTDQEKLPDILLQIKENARQVMENMSDIIWAIKANQSGDLTLENKLKNYGYELLSPLNIRCDYLIDKEADMRLVNMEARKNILLIAKEAMNNVAKYSHASEARLRLAFIEEELQLEISDNGNGFDDEQRHIGNGLQNMKQRGEILGGTLIIRTGKQIGTVVLLSVPLAKISD
ncbi:MAG TPA: histidine kinase [Chitinophagaceae bacterium]|nr:histidine kinase [Chitinophagaceae bacterium]